MIKKKQIDSSKIERDIISQMIISTDFLKMIVPVYESGSLKLNFTNIVADMCVEFFNEFGKAPGKHIQDKYEDLVRIDPDQKQLIKDFLISINAQIQEGYTEYLENVDANLKRAVNHLTHVKISRLQEKIENLKIAKDYQKIEALLQGFRSIRHTYKPSRSLLKDPNFVTECYEDENKSILFQLPGDIGELIGPIRRGGYYLIQAGTGIGKSWFSTYIALYAAFCGVEVALTALEMKGKQTGLRGYHMLTGKTLYKEKDDFLYIPQWDCIHNQTAKCPHCKGRAIAREVSVKKKIGGRMVEDLKIVVPGKEQFELYEDHVVCTDCMDNNDFGAYAHGFEVSTWFKKVTADYASASKTIDYLNVLEEDGAIKGDVHVDSFPRGELSPSDYDAYLHNLKYYEKKEIGLGIIDYADEMKHIDPRDERKSLNYIHGYNKKIAQERNIAIISPTQENDEGKVFGSRKKGHLIDGGIRITQSKWMKARDLIKIESIKQRFGKGSKGQVLWVTQCLALGQVVVDSYWAPEED